MADLTDALEIALAFAAALAEAFAAALAEKFLEELADPLEDAPEEDELVEDEAALAAEAALDAIEEAE